MNANIGVAGEFKCIIRKLDGNVKTESDWQKNLITNKGLEGLSNSSSELFTVLEIGAGNTTPAPTDTALASFIASRTQTAEDSISYSYNQATDGDFYRLSMVRKFSFSALGGEVNISELGLKHSSGNELATHALVKDINGNPASITVLEDETLEVFYKVYLIVDVRDKTGVISLVEDGTPTDYNFVVRPAFVGNKNLWEDCLTTSGKNTILGVSYGNSELSAITTSPNVTSVTVTNTKSLNTPTATQHTEKIAVSVANGNGIWRCLTIRSNETVLGAWQMRFGRVSDDAPITKTSLQKMNLEFTYTFSRADLDNLPE